MNLHLEPLIGPRAEEDRARLLNQIRQSAGKPAILENLRQQAPDLSNIPSTTYSLYRQFEHTGFRRGYERLYFLKRAMLTRAVIEFILGDSSLTDMIQDLLWNICEETSWVLPAHEEQGPDFWEIKPSHRASRPVFEGGQAPWGAHTALTREPDAIDLFCAETGAALAEAVYLIGDQLTPEVVQRVRQEVERRIFKPYLAYGRKHWWYKGPLNWNGVCNGSIGMAFMRLQRDPRTLNEAIAQVLEGFEAYLATGFEADGGSIEGIGYWGYGLMYYVTLAELLREQTGGEIDLLANPRLVDIARYPLVVALSRGTYVNFGDAVEQTALPLGVVQRISERTQVSELRGLLLEPARAEGHGVSAAKLPILLRDLAWWDGVIAPFPQAVAGDYHLTACGIVKLSAKTPQDAPVLLTVKAGHTDGHHSHTDIATFIYNIAGESLLCDPGRGMYSKEYFRLPRYQNIFCNSLGHSVPRIAGTLQAPGPEFGGHRQYAGQITQAQLNNREKSVTIEFQGAYALPELTLARRRITLDALGGAALLHDQFAFAGDSLPVEEAFVTWNEVALNDSHAVIRGKHSSLTLSIQQPSGAVFELQSLEEECKTNQREGILKRLTVQLAPGQTEFSLRLTPGGIDL
jgi:hypothetical protein